ncbi:hypothetical protein [Dyadobacter sp. CY312]|uniref:hypothetical protein n=1 Tax=Dyadobacter sp. CY312 TaxID=2907303 RepID=UPI001F3A05AF|nr:hypothetical protein [Dyadobacter sp. CY312]MCE7038997.1 hypothetical protein [Dyadobacter sp. CY312]
MAVEQLSDWRVVNFPAVPTPGRRYNKKAPSDTGYRPALTNAAGVLIQLDAPTVAEMAAGLDLKQNLIPVGPAGSYYADDKTWKLLNKGAVGLGNVDNTSDANKPLSTAVVAALALKANDADVVKLTGNQTVAGIKTFSASPVVPNASNANQAAAYGQVTTADAALQTQIDNLNTTAATGLKYKGDIDASTNPNFPAAAIGDTYIISTAGKIGGAAGKEVSVGNMLVAKAVTAAGTLAAVGANWTIIQSDLDQATEIVAGFTRYATNAENLAGAISNAAVHPAGMQAKINSTAIKFDAAQALTAPQKAQGWANLGIAFGSTAGTFAQGDDARFTAASAGANRWIFGAGTAADLNTRAVLGGVGGWGGGAPNAPGSFGSILTWVAGSTTGNAVSGSWNNRIMTTTGGDWFVQTGGGTGVETSNWGAQYQIWTSKQFTQTNINSWNNAASAMLWNGGADPEW